MKQTPETTPAAADQWRHDLAAWAIPDEILAQASQSPWIHPVELFTVADEIPDSPSHRAARDALPEGGSVLDVGCGGGRAAFALVPPAALVIGVDHQQGMLDTFATAAQARGVEHREILGDWPDVADQAPEADVVVAHHVVYNVADLVPFLDALTAHARHRVVLELPTRHPLTSMTPLWAQFWGLDRPASPTAEQFVELARGAGYDAQITEWIDDIGAGRAAVDPAAAARFMRIRLCLPEDREDEVAQALAAAGPAQPRPLATVWWDC